MMVISGVSVLVRSSRSTVDDLDLGELIHSLRMSGGGWGGLAPIWYVTLQLFAVERLDNGSRGCTLSKLACEVIRNLHGR